MPGEAVILERDAGVAILRLAEPDNRNALSPAIRARLEALLPDLVDDPAVRAILITGTGASFCAGGDIRSLAEPMTPAACRARMARSYGWIEKLLEGGTPVVTAVNGPAVGAGFGLAMLGDIIVAADTAWFMGGFSIIAVAADYALGRTLPRAVGAVRARDILLTGRKVEATEAERIGMVSRIFPADRLSGEALAIARALAEGPTIALGLTKNLIGAGYEGSASAYLRAEGFAQATAFGSRDHREGVDAFLERRPPRYEGH